MRTEITVGRLCRPWICLLSTQISRCSRHSLLLVALVVHYFSRSSPTNQLLFFNVQQTYSRLQPVGLGRFAYETWVYSSPHLSPCHVVDKALSEFGKGFIDWTPRFMEGPGMGIGEYRGLMKLTWFHKQGRLWEMAYMYNNATPSAESWFWKTYRVEKANAVAVC